MTNYFSYSNQGKIQLNKSWFNLESEQRNTNVSHLKVILKIIIFVAPLFLIDLWMFEQWQSCGILVGSKPW